MASAYSLDSGPFLKTRFSADDQNQIVILVIILFVTIFLGLIYWWGAAGLQGTRLPADTFDRQAVMRARMSKALEDMPAPSESARQKMATMLRTSQ